MTTIDAGFPDHARRSQQSLLALARSAPDRLSTLILQLLEWQERARQRRQLLALSDGALKDFGASRADAEDEGSKPAWQR